MMSDLPDLDLRLHPLIAATHYTLVVAANAFTSDHRTLRLPQLSANPVLPDAGNPTTLTFYTLRGLTTPPCSLWPVSVLGLSLTLRSPHHPHFSVRAYASLLEDTTAFLLRSRFGIATFRDEDNPGVWVRSDDPSRGPDRKIAALGIHLRRHITTLGLALNITLPTKGSTEVNPWARFTPCGIPDRDVTSVAAEVGADPANVAVSENVKQELDPEAIARAWGQEFKRRLEAGG
ncbi:hypothetical protein jhhlp_004229 [Lomentospora prolificans]|uniref:BPL/LPL catalytic domain-containing protein n=1 Tax=Lomentospora prolificans TaxID=41688 RepID=A0A2N3NB24_9PEZI|nr:hypothetical protein jhhlp_004229 [Lomentospora prolificans]